MSTRDRNVTKDLTASASELTLSKRVRGIASPPTASATSTWKELSPDLCCLSRDDLISRFGFDEDGKRRLKIAVDPMTCWKAVVGTDTRSPRMTAYVYQVLCIVAQGRETGATVIELGKKLKHDQKSLFHFVKVLIDLQLVVKFRAHQHKAWTNRVVHRRYLNTSEWFKISVKKDNPPVASTSQPDTSQLACEPAGTTQPPQSDLSENYHVGSSTMDTIINSIENDDQAKTFMLPITKGLIFLEISSSGQPTLSKNCSRTLSMPDQLV
ncbi:hypothetical protein O181_004065 [Austropuccinia psidii MF-1]|uniref:B-block binding subunit of TFIIIC domain-containing protein n=1 Tax=Austropuccinia psidii MF-1 TaxID=1389203 RepID=A0A9Q3GEI4_9BASI|nr:hypothetical protein [Austropuccinia psidii MF-1]